ncbi:MAG: phosphoribosylamine--glycine ligase [Spirochaetales bacterium]|nr:phosphoribosylamine--glycine ligase [Spirochaetales bacterium]
MRVLVLGGGSREHTITWKFARSNRISGLYIAPGNAGTEDLGENLKDVDILDSKSVIKACHDHKIDLVFVGPEQPLAAGIVDALEKEGVPAIGPNRESAQLESSKKFSKDFMVRHKIPTAAAKEFKAYSAFESYIKNTPGMHVIKKSGLASGKGVLESDDKKELLDFGKKILKDDSLLVEEFLTGYEISIFALTDGKTYVLLPPCADFKKAAEDDKGLNTGGMGAICPVPAVGNALMDKIKKEVIEKTFKGLNKDNLNFKGVVYFGLMITEKGPRLLEYNVRFGDPEAQVLLPLIESDFGNLAEAIIKQKLADFPLRISQNSALGVVVASKGYPGAYRKGIPVKPIPDFPEKISLVFHASTSRDKEGRVVTGGGRCFTVVGIGPSLLNANVRAYEAVTKIDFDGSWYRQDIGKKFFID